MSTVNQELSLYIPRVFKTITAEFIVKYFADKLLGKVNKVDYIQIEKDGQKFCSVYIHFEEWFENEFVIQFQQEIEGPKKQIKVLYNNPYFWIVLKNNSKKTRKFEEITTEHSPEMQLYLEKLRKEEEENGF